MWAVEQRKSWSVKEINAAICHRMVGSIVDAVSREFSEQENVEDTEDKDDETQDYHGS